ncbi:MAG: SgcJ/EcaC family oxidoreductase [Anaerolineae bacterium]
MIPIQDERAIRAELDGFGAAWNKGDARALAGYHTDDGVRVGVGGDIQHGKAEIETAYAKMLSGPLRGARVVMDRGEIRLLTPDLAAWQGGIVITTADGHPLKGYAFQVMKRVGDRWLQLESHPKLLVLPGALR